MKKFYFRPVSSKKKSIIPWVFKLFLFLVILSCLIIISGCQKKKAAQVVIPETLAKTVAKIPGGIIGSEEGIRVRFVDPMVDYEQTNKEIETAAFYFDPAIRGKTKWENVQTLLFQPDEPLPLRKEFSGKLDFVALFPDWAKKKIEPIEFKFSVAGREVARVGGDFELENENDPLHLYYMGVVEFTEKTSLVDFEKAISLKVGSIKYPLTLQDQGDGKKFIFKTPVFIRDKSDKSFVLEIDKDLLGLSQDSKTIFSLPRLGEMKVVSLNQSDEKGEMLVKIDFSDPINPNQDIRGLITIQPQIPFTLRTVEKSAYLSANFERQLEYLVTVHPGIKNIWGIASEREFEEGVRFSDLKPEIQFSNDGVFLPSINNQKIRFMTLNVRSVQLRIKKVFESNLVFFLQDERLSNQRDRRQEFNDDYVQRVGIDVAQDKLVIGDKKNVWLQHELDLKKVIPDGEKGLFLIALSFEKEDMLYQSGEGSESEGGYGENEYFSNPNSWGYLYQHGRVYKVVIVSDIGLTYKKAHKDYVVYATDIKNASPLSGVQVTLRTYQNQVVAQGTTGGDGKTEFKNIDQTVFLIEGEKGGQKSIVKPNDMAWNLSTFDVGGEESLPEGTQAFIYTEAGVYRPGEEINLSVILRNQDHTFPDNHPVTLKVYNPKEQLVFEILNKEGKDGFYTFKFQTKENDLTGQWHADILGGAKVFRYPLRIETIVPYRLKIVIQPEKERLTWEDKYFQMDLITTYLFGNPASGLKAQVDLRLDLAPKNFPQYQNFVFNNELIEFKPIQTTIFQDALDKEGKAFIKWELPSLKNTPGALKAVVNARVSERGGRINENTATLPVETYPYYVGIQKPETHWGSVEVGSGLEIPIVLVDPDGEAVAGKPLYCRIYKNTYYWWYQFEQDPRLQLRFKSDSHTELVKEETAISKNVPVNLNFSADVPGCYLVEVQEGKSGHVSTIFVEAYSWAERRPGLKTAELLSLKSDKKRYFIGEEATVTFPSPQEGIILFSIEKGSQILSSKWIKTEKKEGETSVKIPITEDMLPTAYVSISIIQPHAQTANDRPIRTYGVLPLSVEDPTTRQEIQINMTDELLSAKPFKVEIQTEDHTQTQFTIAVVDEGQLALTGFATPNPWTHFFKKLRLGVLTADLFSYIIGVNKGDVFKTFSIGGEEVSEYRQLQGEAAKAKRFKPVHIFKGPLMTDSKGQAKVDFELPDYLGAVRVMVISAKGNRYGNAEKSVPVKTDLMVLPTIPRVLGPGEKITLPVTVFVMRDDIKEVNITIRVEGPLSIRGGAQKSLSFSKTGEQDLNFGLDVKEAVGVGKIIITATSGNYSSKNETEIDIRPSSPRIFEIQQQQCAINNTVSFIIPDKGIEGSNYARLNIQRLPDLNLFNRLRWLIHYPYGCIEQTTSTVFPQLYLKGFLVSSAKDELAIDENINAGINRLRRFQLPSGAFTFWPGGDEPCPWGSNYAGHFLIEAKKLGYHVPTDLFENWKRSMKSEAIAGRGSLTERVYSVYLLTLAGEPEMGAMNLLKENYFTHMSDVEKWMLAGAYQLAGVEDVASEILRSADMKVREYNEFGGTYGSTLRDKAVILEMLVLFNQTERANELAKELLGYLAGKTWYSTQTVGYMLLALGKYLQVSDINLKQPPLMAGTITLPDGKNIPFETNKMNYTLEIKRGFGREIKVAINNKTTMPSIWVILDWNGVPLKSEMVDEAKKLKLTVEWVDEDGNPIDPSSLEQGTTFWGHYNVDVIPGEANESLEELALVQVLPSGWEIENLRLSGEDLPGWASRWNLHREEYLDIRDDRIMWFFDLPYDFYSRGSARKGLDFVVKLNAVTAGEFILPSTVVEAMYRSDFKAVKAGKEVAVTQK